MNAWTRLFAGRKRLAVALAASLVLIGGIAVSMLPVRLYPTVAEPTVTISCTYPGANSRELMNTVAGPIEDQLNGVEHMLYMTSSCADSGAYSCTVTFDVGTDRDVALMKVQTLVQRAMPLLPQEVKNSGLTVSTGTPEELGILTLRSPGRKMSFQEIGDYAYGIVQPAVMRVKGIGNATVRSDKVAMRIWLDPRRMAALGINSEEAISAIRRQNVQASIGSIGATPTGDSQGRTISLIAKGRLARTGEFEDIVVRSGTEGGIVRLRDIARIELGRQAYSYVSFLGDTPAVQIAVSLFPGEDLMRTRQRLVEMLSRLERDFPEDLTWNLTHDATRFMGACLREAATCAAWGMAMLLAALAVLLRGRCGRMAVWRLALLIPVAVLPAFMVVLMVGESINILVLVAIYMAAGLVALDLMAAARGISSMAVVASAMAVAALFVPVGAFGGLTGALYRQFAVVVVSVALLSALIAASAFSPVAADNVPCRETKRQRFAFLSWGTSFAERGTLLTMAFTVFAAVAAAAFARLTPSTLVPDEDTGYFNVNVETPEGTRMPVTAETSRCAAEAIGLLEGVSSVLTLCGTSNTGGAGENQALVVVEFDDWHKRAADGLDSRELARRIVETNAVLPLAAFHPLPPATLPGLGGAVQLLIMSTADDDAKKLAREAHRMTRLIADSPLVERAVCGYTATTPHLRVKVDREKCELLKVPLSALFATLQNYLGSLYVNDINLGTQVNRVTVEADWFGRADREAVKMLFVRSDTGAMVPVEALVSLEEELGPRVCYRYNKYVYCGVSIIPAEGVSTREAIDETIRIIDDHLPRGFAYAWGNLTFHEMRGMGKGALMSVVAILAAYLVLVGFFNSWRRPFTAVLPVSMIVLAVEVASCLVGIPVSMHARMAMLFLSAMAVKCVMLVASSQSPWLMRGRLCSVAAAISLSALPFLLSSGAGRNALHSVGLALCVGAAGLALSMLILPERRRNPSPF